MLLGSDLLAVSFRILPIARIYLGPMLIGVLPLLRDQLVAVRDISLARRYSAPFNERFELDWILFESFPPAACRSRRRSALSVGRCARACLSALRLRETVSFAEPREADRIVLQFLVAHARGYASPLAGDRQTSRIVLQLFAIPSRTLPVVRFLSLSSGLIHAPSDTKSAESCQWD